MHLRPPAFIVVLFAIASTLAVSVAHSEPTEKPFIDDVRAKLNREADFLAAQHFRRDKSEEVKMLKRDERMSIPMHIDAGATYAVVAACDSDCTHVEVALYDNTKKLLMRSPEDQPVVIINGTPKESGDYLAEVGVPGCKEKSCDAGMLLLRLESQGNVQSPATTTSPASPKAPNPETAFVTFSNSDILGGDFKNVRNVDEKSCSTACMEDAQCLAYSFDSWNKSCYLKAAVTELSLDPRSTTGVRATVEAPSRSKASVTMERFHNKAFPYANQEASKSDSTDDCERRCVKAEKCVAYTYFKQRKLCRLMESTGQYFSDPTADCGAKRQSAK